MERPRLRPEDRVRRLHGEVRLEVLRVERGRHGHVAAVAVAVAVVVVVAVDALGARPAGGQDDGGGGEAAAGGRQREQLRRGRGEVVLQ